MTATRKGGRSWRRAAAATLALLGLCVAVAQADPLPTDPLGSPTDVAAPNPDNPPVDTEGTPVAKDGCPLGWTQLGGAVFPGATPCNGPVAHTAYSEAQSATVTTADFYAVRFHDLDHGFAAGAECRDPATSADKLDSCPRVPVVYSYVRQRGDPTG